MIISGSGKVQSVLKTYADQVKTNKSNTGRDSIGSRQASDEVVLSPQAQNFAQFLQAAGAAADVRTDKVTDLSNRIASGSYHVAAQDIAAKILGRA